MTKNAIERTSKGLVDALFDNIDALNKKEIDAEHARAVAQSAKAIVGVAALELNVRKFQKEQSQPVDAIKSLAIETQPTST